MAKPLGAKSKLIREALNANPDLGNKEVAELINDTDARKDDKIKISAADVANQRQALKKARHNGPARKGSSASKPAQRGEQPRPAATANPVELIDRVFDLARQCGGLAELKRLVDRIA